MSVYAVSNAVLFLASVARAPAARGRIRSIQGCQIERYVANWATLLDHMCGWGRLLADFHRHVPVAVAVAVSVKTVSVPAAYAVAAGAGARQ